MVSSPQSPWAASRASLTAVGLGEGPPAVTERSSPGTRSVISGPDAQAAIWFLGVLSQVRLSGEQTGGAFSLTDNLARRGSGSPVHVHDREDETFFVLDGELRVLVGEDDYTANSGRRWSPVSGRSALARASQTMLSYPRGV
jgi:mannose-6-phosphate isomerase-like protein (cupin superfamily)